MTNNPLPAPYPAYPARADGSGALGVVSLVIGIVLVVWGFANQVIATALPLIQYNLGLGPTSYSAYFTTVAVITSIIAIAGIVTGIIGILPARRGRLAAAAGLAIAVSHLLGNLVSLIAPGLINLFA